MQQLQRKKQPQHHKSVAIPKNQVRPENPFQSNTFIQKSPQFSQDQHQSFATQHSQPKVCFVEEEKQEEKQEVKIQAQQLLFQRVNNYRRQEELRIMRIQQQLLQKREQIKHLFDSTCIHNERHKTISKNEFKYMILCHFMMLEEDPAAKQYELLRCPVIVLVDNVIRGFIHTLKQQSFQDFLTDLQKQTQIKMNHHSQRAFIFNQKTQKSFDLNDRQQIIEFQDFFQFHIIKKNSLIVEFQQVGCDTKCEESVNMEIMLSQSSTLNDVQMLNPYCDFFYDDHPISKLHAFSDYDIRNKRKITMVRKEKRRSVVQNSKQEDEEEEEEEEEKKGIMPLFLRFKINRVNWLKQQDQFQEFQISHEKFSQITQIDLKLRVLEYLKVTQKSNFRVFLDFIELSSNLKMNSHTIDHDSEISIRDIRTNQFFIVEYPNKERKLFDVSSNSQTITGSNFQALMTSNNGLQLTLWYNDKPIRSGIDLLKMKIKNGATLTLCRNKYKEVKFISNFKEQKVEIQKTKSFSTLLEHINLQKQKLCKKYNIQNINTLHSQISILQNNEKKFCEETQIGEVEYTKDIVIVLKFYLKIDILYSQGNRYLKNQIFEVNQSFSKVVERMFNSTQLDTPIYIYNKSNHFNQGHRLYQINIQSGTEVIELRQEAPQIGKVSSRDYITTNPKMCDSFLNIFFNTPFEEQKSPSLQIQQEIKRMLHLLNEGAKSKNLTKGIKGIFDDKDLDIYQKCLKVYSGHLGVLINKYLCLNRFHELVNFLKQIFITKSQFKQQYHYKNPKNYLYRGFHCKQKTNLEVGEKIFFPCFTSSSKSIKTAKKFTIENAKERQMKYILLLRIAPNSAPHNAEIKQDIAMAQDEREVLFFPYSYWKVMRIYKKGCYRYIQLKEIPNDPIHQNLKIEYTPIIWLNQNIVKINFKAKNDPDIQHYEDFRSSYPNLVLENDYREVRKIIQSSKEYVILIYSGKKYSFIENEFSKFMFEDERRISAIFLFCRNVEHNQEHKNSSYVKAITNKPLELKDKIEPFYRVKFLRT